jgi:hypothetical protein
VIRAAIFLAILGAATAAEAQPIAYPSFSPGRNFTAAARWLQREAGIPRRDVIAVADGLAFVAAPQAGQALAGVPAPVHVEVLDAEAWKAFGWRSAILFVAADCAARTATLRSADLYAGANLLGEARRGLSPAAVPIPPDALSQLALGLCARAQVPIPPPPAAPPAPVVVASLAAEPARSTPERPAAPAPTPAPPAPSPPPPKPAAPAVVAPAAPEPVPPRPRPEPAPAAVVATPVRPTARALALRGPVEPSPPPAAAAAAEAPAAAPTVQIGAFGSTESAMLALRDLTAAMPKLFAGKLQRLEPMSAQGGMVYRAVVTGFRTAPEAAAFCHSLVAAGRACLVRNIP